MGEHDVVPLPQEIFGTCAESGWGTCGELLLVSAVKRHGVNKWSLISKELMDRAIFLNANPLCYSEVACKQKFDVLKGRHTSSSSSSRSRIEDLVYDMNWFEELRKLRVFLLKRELEQYDASIGNLQIKIERLKAEKAPDTSVSTQVRNSFANSQSIEEVFEGSSCKFSVQGRVDKPVEGDYNELHSTVALGSIINSEVIMSSQAPSNSLEQVSPDVEQLHDAYARCNAEHPTHTDVKTSVDLISNSPFPKSVNGGINFEQDYAGNYAVISLAETQFHESPSLQERLADDLEDMEIDEVGVSNMDEHRELVLSQSGYQLVDELGDASVKHEAGKIVAHALDNDEVEVGILDLQVGGKLVLKMDVIKDRGLGVVHADFGPKGLARTFATSAHSMMSMNTSKNRGFDYAETETRLKEDVVLPILPSNQPPVLSENVGNGEFELAERNTMTEERLILSKNEIGISEFGKAQTVEVDDHTFYDVAIKNVFVAFPLHSIFSADEVLHVARNSFRGSEGCHHCEEGVASTIQDEVISCEQKQLLLEELDSKEDDSTVHDLKELTTLGDVNGGSNGTAMENAIRAKWPERISAVIPFASFTNFGSSFLRDGAVLISEKLDARVPTKSSELFNISDVSKGSPSPMRHIVTALDDPGITIPRSESTDTTPASAEVKSAQLSTTSSDVNCDTEASGMIEEQCISAQSSRTLDSLEQKSWESRDSGARCSMQVAEYSVSVSDHDSLLISSENIQVEPGERLDNSEKSALPVYLGQNSVAFAANFEGRQSCDSWMKKFPSTAVPHCLVVAKTVQEFSVKIAQIPPGLQNTSCGSESTMPERIDDMKLEYGKKELSGVDSEAEVKSPLKSCAGGLDSRMHSSREGSDNMQDQYKDGSDRNKEKTQDNRYQMEIAFDNSEVRSTLGVPFGMSPNSRRNLKESRVPGKLFSLVEVFRNLSNHKSAVFFKGRQEDPRYSLLIRRHVDLNFVRARLDEGAYSSRIEFFRDLFLIFNNGMVYFTRESVEFRGAKALFRETTKEMYRIFRSEALLKQGRPATRTREVKKLIAFTAPSIGVASSAKLADTISPLTSLFDGGIKKRASSRLGIAETPTNSLPKGGAPGSATVNVFRDPGSSQAEEAVNSQENYQEVNGRLKDRKRSQKSRGSSTGKPHREELVECFLLKDPANKSLGEPQMRALKVDEPLARLQGTCGETLADPESAIESEPVKEKMRGIVGEIDDCDVSLWRGKSLSKLVDLSVTPERDLEVKSFPKSRPIEAALVGFKSHGNASQDVRRPSRSGRKLVTPANEPVRPSFPQAKKRVRR